MSGLRDALVDAAFNDDDWGSLMRDVGAETAVAVLGSVYADIGQQILQRQSDIGNLRDDDVDDEEYVAAMFEYREWIRSATAVRRAVQKRIKQAQPELQRLQDRHQADRRALLRLAKRVWLWEQGAEVDDLDTALDDLTVSYGATEDRTLREAVELLIDSLPPGAEVRT